MEDIVVKKGRPASEKKEEIKATKPGWRPASRLGVLKAPPGFTARWVSDDSANVAKKKAEGWIMMKPKDNLGTEITQQDVADTKGLGECIKYRDMVAMMLPDDLKEARDEFHREEVRSATRVILKDVDSQLGQKGVQTYKPKGMSGRIIID